MGRGSGREQIEFGKEYTDKCRWDSRSLDYGMCCFSFTQVENYKAVWNCIPGPQGTISATVNVIDGRAIFRMDIGLCIVWPLLRSLYKIPVLGAYQEE